MCIIACVSVCVYVWFLRGLFNNIIILTTKSPSLYLSFSKTCNRHETFQKPVNIIILFDVDCGTLTFTIIIIMIIAYKQQTNTHTHKHQTMENNFWMQSSSFECCLKWLKGIDWVCDGCVHNFWRKKQVFCQYFEIYV